jgi:16S rRNA (cytosine967-C5)-methyltransferase
VLGETLKQLRPTLCYRLRAVPHRPEAVDVEAGPLGKVEGRPTRTAAAAALRAHVAVLKGKPLRAALSEALADDEKLGGKERRFVAFATRELSRHSRYLDLVSRSRGHAPSALKLPEDQAIARYVLWRCALTGASPKRAVEEAALPGPLRPRSVPDALLVALVGDGRFEVPLPDAALERAAALHSFPNWLAEAIARGVPEDALEPVLAALNRESAIMLRARPPTARTSVREELATLGVATTTVEHLPGALRLSDGSRAVFDSGPMKNGRLLTMDFGSQEIVALCAARPGQRIVDLCAGAGGKSIALADDVGPTGVVFACDISARRLDEARRRCRTLKVKNVQFPAEPELGDCDLVLIDAPCSGTGTLAREPDRKWKLKPDEVRTHVATQETLLKSTARRVREGAAIVYATCSLLPEENQEQVALFLAAHPHFALEESVQVLPHQAEGGGFFAARLRRQGRAGA